MTRNVLDLVTGLVHESMHGYSDQDETEQGVCDEFMNGHAWQETNDDVTCMECLGVELGPIDRTVAQIDRKVHKALQLPPGFVKGR